MVRAGGQAGCLDTSHSRLALGGEGGGYIYIYRFRFTKKQKIIIYIYIHIYIYIKDCPTTIDFDWIARHFNRFRFFVSLSLGWLFWVVCGSFVGVVVLCCHPGLFVVLSIEWLFWAVCSFVARIVVLGGL